MNSSIKKILEDVRSGNLSVDAAALKLKIAPFEDIGYAKVDHHRALRQGIAEIIYGAGKTSEQIIGIVDSMKKSGQSTILVTRLSKEMAGRVGDVFPLAYHAEARIGIIG